MECNYYLDLVETRIKQRLEQVCQPLLTNGCNTIEHFKLHSGIKIGLEEALIIARKVYKEVYESNVVDSKGIKQGVGSGTGSKKSREFY